MGWPTKTPKTPRLTRDEALNCTPVKNEHVRESRLESGELLILYPVSTPPWTAALARWLGAGKTPPRTRRLQLDRLGSSVWDMLDGRTPLRQLVAVFAKAHQLEPKEAEVAVTQFIRELGRRGLIGLR
jgi:hypothetical protein